MKHSLRNIILYFKCNILHNYKTNFYLFCSVSIIKVKAIPVPLQSRDKVKEQIKIVLNGTHHSACSDKKFKSEFLPEGNTNEVNYQIMYICIIRVIVKNRCELSPLYLFCSSLFNFFRYGVLSGGSH